MSKTQREKGKNGEREACHKWGELFGVEMRRSQQFCGRSDEADDIIGQPGVSIEVKRRERVNVALHLAQCASEAAEGNVPVLLHRADRKPWVVSLYLDDLPELVAKLYLTLAEKA